MTPASPDLLVLAVALDLLLGDPRWLPHPVVLIGRLVTVLENRLRELFRNLVAAGVILLLAVVSISACATLLLLHVATLLHPMVGILAAALVSWTCLAARSLHTESALVARELTLGNLPEARRLLSRIVGRDTEQLDESEIWRALIETVAENTTDGIIAPLFWLTVGGPVAAIAYKAVSTLDSMVGYKNDRYLLFGRASARMDDLLNLIPARLTAVLMVVAAPLVGLSFRGALKIVLRDRLNHPSPNSAHAEAAAAGALGVRLGGRSTYGGRESWKQTIGDPLVPLDGTAYSGMLRLMYSTTALMALFCFLTAMLIRG